jgi:2'-5' RNA ligase
MKKRIFISTGEMSAGILAEVKKAQKDFADFEIRWVKSEQLHVTLSFLGEIDEEEIPEVISIVKESAQNYRPSTLALHGLGVFPEAGRPRVLWMGFNHLDRGKRLAAIAFSLQQKLILAGFAQKDRLVPSEKISTTGEWVEFEAHLTLGRFKEAKGGEALQKLLDKYQDTTFGEMRLEAIYVMESELTSEGPIYKVIERVELEGLE